MMRLASVPTTFAPVGCFTPSLPSAPACKQDRRQHRLLLLLQRSNVTGHTPICAGSEHPPRCVPWRRPPHGRCVSHR
jgi:hypothetical protein